MFDPVPRAEFFEHIAAVTPPAESPAAFLGWAVAILALVVSFVFGLFLKSQNGALTRAIADKNAAEKETNDLRSDHKSEIAALRASSEREIEILTLARDEAIDKRRREMKQFARTVQTWRQQQAARGQVPTRMLPKPAHRIAREEPDTAEDYELSTGVTEALLAAEIDRIEEEARESTPPRYRPKLPSRHDK